jgi:hypothetical protein
VQSGFVDSKLHNPNPGWARVVMTVRFDSDYPVLTVDLQSAMFYSSCAITTPSLCMHELNRYCLSGFSMRADGQGEGREKRSALLICMHEHVHSRLKHFYES